MKDIAKHIHFIGIGGIGMSGLARIMLGFGVPCSGSDVAESKVVLDLRELGAAVAIGHAAENIAPDVDLVIYSSAIKASNPELQKAYDLGIKVVGRAELLAMIMQKKYSIAVAGAHGKTTTTGMIGTMLKYSSMEPTIIVGGQLPYIGANACWGSGKYLVAEADESDGSFLCLKPHIAVVNNIENDHLDHYGDMEHLIAAFAQYIDQVPDDGCAVLGIDSPIVAQLAATCQRKYITFAIDNENADVRAENISYNGFGSSFDLVYRGEKLGTINLSFPGKYNVENALSSVAVGLVINMDFADIAAGLAEFSGTGRRFEKLGANDVRHIAVYDDYAHHPTELASVLSAAKQLPYKRVIGVFQPHRYSRTQMLVNEFAVCFDDCDIIIINGIYGAFEPPIDGVSGQLLVDAIKEHGKHSATEIYYAKEIDDVVPILEQIVQDDDLVMIMGAGNIRRAGEKFADIINN